MFFVLPPTAAGRDALLGHLRAEGIHAVLHDIPLHCSPLGCRLGWAGTHLPITDDLSARIVRLPMYYEMTEEEQERVAEALMACCPAAPPSCESGHAVRAAPGWPVPPACRARAEWLYCM